MTARTELIAAQRAARNPAVRWCTCGLRMAGTGLQVAEMAAVHWRGSLCPWRLLTYDPRRLSSPPTP